MSVYKSVKIFCGGLICAYLLTGVFVCPLAQAQEPQYYKIDELITRGQELDGKEVIIQGEVIGDVMPRRNGHLWFNVQDSTGVMGVWAHGELAREIIAAGDYNYKGDEVEVSGTFKRADHELGGETCLRAVSVDILKRGHRIEHTINPIKTRLAAFLAVLAGALLVLRMMIQRRG